MVTATGYTFDQAEALTLPRLITLLDYWEDHPPAHELLKGLHRMVAAFLGIEQDDDERHQDRVSDDLADFFPGLEASGYMVTEEG